MVFPVVTYGCESWTVKKADCQKIDAFKLWCWRRLLKVHWTARSSNQSILREINPEYSLERLMLKPKLQYFRDLMWTDNSLGKSLMLGRIEGRRRRGCQRMRWLDNITDAMGMNLDKLRRWWGTVHGTTKSWTWMSNWTMTITMTKLKSEAVVYFKGVWVNVFCSS